MLVRVRVPYCIRQKGLKKIHPYIGLVYWENFMSVILYTIHKSDQQFFQVYCLLSNELPNFRPDNWTSELRGEVPGFESYPPGSLGAMTTMEPSRLCFMEKIGRKCGKINGLSIIWK